MYTSMNEPTYRRDLLTVFLHEHFRATLSWIFRLFTSFYDFLHLLGSCAITTTVFSFVVGFFLVLPLCNVSTMFNGVKP